MKNWIKLSKLNAQIEADGDIWVRINGLKYMRRFVSPDYTIITIANGTSVQDINVSETPETILGKNLI